jgi:hypothetical protein
VPAGETALAFGPRLALFNDAGFGMEHAGVAGLAILDRACIAATTVSTMSARIGDGRSRSEERRVGKACRREGRSRWSPDH